MTNSVKGTTMKLSMKSLTSRFEYFQKFPDAGTKECKKPWRKMSGMAYSSENTLKYTKLRSAVLRWKKNSDRPAMPKDRITTPMAKPASWPRSSGTVGQSTEIGRASCRERV